MDNVCGCAGLWLCFRLNILSIHLTWYRLSHLTELECWAVLYCRICQAWAGGGNFACSCQAVEREVWLQKLWEQLPESLLSGTWDCVSTPFQGKASILVTNGPVCLCLEAHYGYVYTSDLACIRIKYLTHPPKTFSGYLAVVQVSAVWLQETWTLPLKLHQDLCFGSVPLQLLSLSWNILASLKYFPAVV